MIDNNNVKPLKTKTMRAETVKEGQRRAGKAEDKFIQGIDKVLAECEDEIFGKGREEGEVTLKVDQQFPATIDLQRETVVGLTSDGEGVAVRLQGGREEYVTGMKEWEAVEIYRKFLLVLSEGKW